MDIWKLFATAPSAAEKADHAVYASLTTHSNNEVQR